MGPSENIFNPVVSRETDWNWSWKPQLALLLLFPRLYKVWRNPKYKWLKGRDLKFFVIMKSSWSGDVLSTFTPRESLIFHYWNFALYQEEGYSICGSLMTVSDWRFSIVKYNWREIVIFFSWVISLCGICHSRSRNYISVGLNSMYIIVCRFSEMINEDHMSYKSINDFVALWYCKPQNDYQKDESDIQF